LSTYDDDEMERARATWTDERLDDLSHRMDDGFNRVDADLRSLRTQMESRFESLETRIEGRIDALQRTMIQLTGGMLAAILATLATVLVTGV
jgi:hypothetical protein